MVTIRRFCSGPSSCCSWRSLAARRHRLVPLGSKLGVEMIWWAEKIQWNCRHHLKLERTWSRGANSPVPRQIMIAFLLNQVLSATYLLDRCLDSEGGSESGGCWSDNQWGSTLVATYYPTFHMRGTTFMWNHVDFWFQSSQCDFNPKEMLTQCPPFTLVECLDGPPISAID